MATKKEVLEQAARGAGCLGRAADDEPVFVLRAHDPAAADLVLAWVRARTDLIVSRSKPLQDTEAVRDAIEIINDIQKWRATDAARERARGIRPAEKAE